ncbi:MAG: anthranilate synthase component I [Deltaproteobacteria bacterium]|nr:anthranilate synthase component I [Deltaproteobacteria bacterium]
MSGPKTLAQVRKAVNDGANVVPLVRQFHADTLTPVGAFLRIRQPDEPSFLLESVEGGEHFARYSFLGARPLETITVENGVAGFRRSDGEGVLEGCPFKALGERLERFRALDEPGLPRFCGGAVGHVGYEMVRYLEPSVDLKVPEGPEARLMVFGNVVAFDRLKHRVLLIASVIADGSGSLKSAYDKAVDALDDMEERLRRPPGAPSSLIDLAGDGTGAFPDGPGLKGQMGAEAFMDGVRRLKRRIKAGDIFQAVLSEQFDVPLKADPFEVYRRLRAINPSPYMFFVGTRDDAVLGASPEMLVRVDGDKVQTRPIAGTRPRGADDAEDQRHERNLLASVKERAEHIMLVDLGRNDVGRVARPGTVRVPSLMQVERYSHVMHMVSSVQAVMRRGLSPWDAFAACFPAGTVSGAPKIRAMQLVSGIEPVPRGPYAGAVVYRDFRGNLDSCITIRSLSVKGRGDARRAVFQAGAGIVADSRPASELREIQSKAGAVLESIGLAQERP